MKIVRTIKDMQNISDRFRAEGKKISLVPTMGYFHEGHLSLMKRGKELADIVITTLFVNPTQFSPNEDLDKYPRDFDRDRKLAENAGADFLFFPDVKEMYPDGFDLRINIGGVTSEFEGKSRPTHFSGVATVVAKLFLATNPHIALFGQKDYQQTLVVRKLNHDLNFNIDIAVSPTIREADGLAMSSRNKYLSAEHRGKATILFKALEAGRLVIESGERDRKIINAHIHKTLRTVSEIRIDYACTVDAGTLGVQDKFDAGQKVVILLACYLGKTRLIDNALITIPAKFPPVAMT